MVKVTGNENGKIILGAYICCVKWFEDKDGVQ